MPSQLNLVLLIDGATQASMKLREQVSRCVCMCVCVCLCLSLRLRLRLRLRLCLCLCLCLSLSVLEEQIPLLCVAGRMCP